MVTVTFSEAVTVSGEPRVRLEVGGQKRWARYDRSEQDGALLVFAYNVKKTDADENGVSAKKNALGLNGGTIQDADGNAARLKAPALPDQSGHKVDGSRKSARGEPVEPPAQQESPADRPGTVFLSLATDPPTVGSVLSASLLDADGVVGNVAWSWQRSSDGETWEDISGATGASYTVTEDDEEYYLRATAAYTDGHGPGKTASAATSDTVATPVPAPEQQIFSNSITPDTTPPTYSLENFSRQHPESGQWEGYRTDRLETFGTTRLQAQIFFSEPIDESRATIRYRVGSGRERTFSFTSSINPASGECRYAGSNSYECYYTPTAGESGLFQVRVSAYEDTSGNAGTPGSYHTGWGITVDTRAPAAPKLALKNPASSPSNDLSPEFTATLSETGGQLYIWQDRNYCGDFRGLGRQVKVDVNDSAPPYTADITSRDIRSEGSVTYYALHLDTHFNTSPCVEAFTYVYDITPPDAPTGLVVTRPGAGQARLTWADPNDPTIGKYQFRQKTTTGIYPSEWTDIPGSDADTVSHTVTSQNNWIGLDDGTQYFFQLRAVDTAGNESDPAEALSRPRPRTVPADWPLIPRGVQPGEEFRLLFVTSGTRNATSNDINVYNTFVQQAAAQNASLSEFSGDFRALISTGKMNARDNTLTEPAGTSYAPNEGVPIYWLGGEKVADYYHDLYDRSWDSIEARTETGARSPAIRVWTVSNPDGTVSVSLASVSHRQGLLGDELRLLAPGSVSMRHFSYQVNAASMRLESPTHALLMGNPFSAISDDKTKQHPLYALSPVLVAGTPSPTALRPAAAPRIVDARIVTEPAKGQAYGKSERVVIALDFDRPVAVYAQDVATPPELRINIGSLSRAAPFWKSEGGGTRFDGSTLLFAYAVPASVTRIAGELSVSASDTPFTFRNDGDRIYDPATGGDADLSIGQRGPFWGHDIDNQQDNIAGATLDPPTHRWWSYRTLGESRFHDRLDVVEFLVPVPVDSGRTLHVEGSPTIDIKIGGNVRQARAVKAFYQKTGSLLDSGHYVSFRYMVSMDDYDHVGAYVERVLVHMDRKNYIYTLSGSERKRTGMVIHKEMSSADRIFVQDNGGSGVTATKAYPFPYRVDGLAGDPGPAAPANLRAVPGDGTVRLSWDYANDSHIGGWLIWREDDPRWRVISMDGMASSHEVTGLANGELYRFLVRAFYRTSGSMSYARAGEPSHFVQARPQPWLDSGR